MSPAELFAWTLSIVASLCLVGLGVAVLAAVVRTVRESK